MGSAETTIAGTNAERVYEDLRALIIGGEYAPGERLRAEALAARFGTSRTPVREALMLLEGDGLVEIEPRRGAARTRALMPHPPPSSPSLQTSPQPLGIVTGAK